MNLAIHGCTYFIANPQDKIKIGHSRYLPRRFGELEKQYDTRLTLMAIVMSSFAEYDLHKRFAHLRVKDSEWFILGEKLIEYIEGLNCNPIGSEEVRQFWNCIEDISDEINYCSACGDSISSHIVYTEFLDEEKKFPQKGIGFCPDCYRNILQTHDLDFTDFKDRGLHWANREKYAPNRAFSFDGKFGKIVKIMLAAHNLSQEDLARKTGINSTIISRICNGHRSPRKYLMAIKDVLSWTKQAEDACRILLEEIGEA